MSKAKIEEIEQKDKAEAEEDHSYPDKIKDIDDTERRIKTYQDLLDTLTEQNTQLQQQINIMVDERSWTESLYQLCLEFASSKHEIAKNRYLQLDIWYRSQIINLLDSKLSKYQLLQLRDKLKVDIVSLENGIKKLIESYKQKINENATIKELYETIKKESNISILNPVIYNIEYILARHNIDLDTYNEIKIDKTDKQKSNDQYLMLMIYLFETNKDKALKYEIFEKIYNIYKN